MKKFNLIVTGNLTMTVEADTEEEAQEKADKYLEINSPVSNYEVYLDGDQSVYDHVDIEVI